jgi:hypothetical protein
MAQESTAISATELECYRDAEWAMHDPEVQRRYHGLWVVAYRRQIIAHGTDPLDVARQAEGIASGVSHHAVFCAAQDADAWRAHNPDPSLDTPNA